MDTQTQIDRLIELAIVQRAELKKLVSELPQLREHLNAEIERVFESTEPQLRTELEDWTTKQAKDQTTKLGGELEAKITALSKSLEATTQTRYNAIMAERAQNIDLAKKAEDKLAEVAQAIPVQVKQIVTDELARFPRAGEIDQLRKEFAEPRGLNPRGRWQAGETYNKLDLVSYNGDSYVSNTDGNREKPSRSSEAWTLSAARGNGGAGGGVTSLTDLVAVPANGELLIGNGSAFVNNTLTAGAGVTITNGPGTITIDASGAQELLTATVTNAESFAITRGQVVYLFGAVGNRASVKLADNSADATSAKTFGVVSDASIAANGIGLVTCVGVVDKLALGAYNDGDTLYLGNTPGSVTVTKPYAPNHLVYVGIVERANNGNGELYVKIQNGYELDEIHDVQITTPPLAGSLLMRDATNSLWKANRLTGTANQVTVTNADTAVTLSLPTAIANVNSVTAATTQNLTLAGGSTGASLVLVQGANAAINITSNGSGSVNVNPGSTGSVNINSASGVGKLAVRTGTNENAHFRTATAIGGTGVGLDMLNDASGATVGFTLRSSATRLTGGNVTVPDGNLLIGTTTDSGNGKLQLATHTTSAGGIGFGTDLSLYRVSGNTMAAKFQGGTKELFFYSDTGNTGIFDVANVGAGYDGIYFNSTTKSAVIATNGTTALTLASNQAATFAGAVTGASTITSGYHSATPPSVLGAFNAGIPTSLQKEILVVGDASRRVSLAAYQDASPYVNWSFLMQGTELVRMAANPSSVVASGTMQVFGITSASSSTSGAFLVGNGTAATNVAIGGGNINAGGTGTFAGAVTVNSVTPSTGAGSGALQVAGGIYSGANSYFTGQITSARPFMATGSIAANMTSAGGIGFAGGGANVFSFGANASTTGAFSVQLVSSDASLNFNALTIAANTGAAAFSGGVTGSSFEFNATGAARLKPSDGYVYFQVGGSAYYSHYPNSVYSEIATNNATYKHIRFVPTSNGSVVVNNAAVATTATSGFLYVPTCAGAPTGVPASHTGTAPIVIDTTNNKLYFYSGGAWRDAGP